ncbi:MAG: Ig-like domain-containing protein [Candidatus Muiribacteriota bacterium]
MKKIILLITLISLFNPVFSIVREHYPTSQKSISKDTPIYLRFSKEMDEEFINRFTFILNDGVSDIRGKVVYIPEEKKASFIPNNYLKEGNTYRAMLYKGVKAEDGTKLKENYVWSFRVTGKTDIIQTIDDFDITRDINPKRKEDLSILTTEPEQNTIIEKTNPIVVKFSAPIDESTVNHYTFMVKGKKAKTDGKIEVKDNSIIFKPFKPFELDSNYRVMATNFIKDINGSTLKETYEFSFQTAGVRKDEFPEVVETYPGNFDKNVAPNSSIIARFSKKMDPSTLNRFNVILSDGTQNVWGNISYNEKERVLLFEPEKPLPANMNCKFRIRGNVKDTEGKFLNDDFILEFRTGSQKEVLIHDKLSDSKHKLLELEDTKEEKETPSRERFLMREDSLFFVKNYFPGDRENNIDVESSIYIEFSARPRIETVNEFTVVLSDGVKNIWGDVEYDKKAHKAWFIPREPLRHNTLYYVRVSTDIKDVNGNNLDKFYEWAFVTEPLPDKTPPKIVEIHPEDKEEDLSEDVVIKARFSEEIRTESLNKFTVRISDGKDYIKTDITYDSDKNIAFISPVKDLQKNTQYRVILGPAISDLGGNFMDEELEFSFWVGSPPNITPPVILSVSPRENAPVYTKKPVVSVTFNEEMDTQTLSPFNFGLLKEDGTPVKGVVEYSEINHRAIYNYHEELEYGKIYKVFVSERVEDIAGNKYGNNISWEFIISHPEETLPEVKASFPYMTKTNFPVTSDIIVQFNKDMNPVSFNSFTISLSDNKNFYYSGEIVYDSEKRELIFKPQDELPFNTKFELEVSKFIQDTEGKNMKEDYNLIFYTEGRGHVK